MVSACTFCGRDVRDHQPVFVSEGGDGERVHVGQFCNYACLAQYIEAEGLEMGACCRLDPPSGGPGGSGEPSRRSTREPGAGSGTER